MHLLYNELGLDEPVRISAVDAAKISREQSIAVLGRDVYGDDEEALQDFITTHWAWLEPEGGPPVPPALSLAPVEDPCP